MHVFVCDCSVQLVPGVAVGVMEWGGVHKADCEPAEQS